MRRRCCGLPCSTPRDRPIPRSPRRRASFPSIPSPSRSRTTTTVFGPEIPSSGSGGARQPGGRSQPASNTGSKRSSSWRIGTGSRQRRSSMTERPVLSIRSLQLHEVALPLIRPFRTSFGEERDKRAILVRVDAGDVEGWGECVAAEQPRYSEEWLDGAWRALQHHLGPSLLTGGAIAEPEEVGRRLDWVRGHRMAKAALEAAVLDAWLRLAGRSLSEYMGGVRDRVACGVSVGIVPAIDALLDEVRGYLDDGY